MHAFIINALIIAGAISLVVTPIVFMHIADTKWTEREATPKLLHKTCEHHDLTPDSAKSSGTLLGEALAPMMMGVLNALFPIQGEKA